MVPGSALPTSRRAAPALLFAFLVAFLALALAGVTAGCSSKSLTPDPSACAGRPVPTIACAVGPTVQTCALDANGRPTWVTSCPGESSAGTTGSGGAAGGGAGGAAGGTDAGALGEPCSSDEACQRGLVCTVSDGVCNAPPGCSAPNTACPAVCYGTCRAPSRSCTADKDCRLQADYCTGCDCRILGSGDSLPACPGPGVSCFVDPCASLSVHCQSGICVSP